MSWQGERDAVLSSVMREVERLRSPLDELCRPAPGRMGEDQAMRYSALAQVEHAVCLLDRIDRNLGRVADALEALAATWAKPPVGRT